MQNNTTNTTKNAIIVVAQDTNYSTKDICLALYNDQIHLCYQSLRTLLQAISVAEKGNPIGLYASEMLAYVNSSTFDYEYKTNKSCLKAILGILITLL